MYRLIPFALILSLTAYFTAGSPTRAEEFIEIETVINITATASGAVMTTQQAEDAVAKANEILKQAKIRLKVKKVNGPTSAAAQAGNADGNSSFDRAERDKAREEGGKELDGEVGRGKGIKITFGATVQQGHSTNPGISIHHHRCTLCSNRATSQLSGETIAHEVGHILTLSAGHVITSTQVADAGGHSPDPGNFMNPSDTRTGTSMTTQQAEEMRKKAKDLGRTVSQPATSVPATSQPHGSGGRQDERRDAFILLPPSGLDYMHAYHRHGDPQMQLHFAVEDPIDPFGPPMQWRYAWLFDIDNNPFTGAFIFGVQGVERGVEIQINIGGGNIFSSAQFRDYVGTNNFPLPPTEITLEPEFDLTNTPAPGQTSFRNSVPFAPLGIIETELVPMHLVSINPMTNLPVDFLSSEFQVDYESDKAQLGVLPPLAAPGSSVFYFGSGFTPLTPATLFLDDTMFLPAFVNPDGTVFGSFNLPTTPAPLNFYFATVIDGEGRSGFNVIHVLPCIAGDCNRDGEVSTLDIDPFVLAVTGATNDPDILCAADVNGDGAVDGLDIQPFVQLLLN